MKHILTTLLLFILLQSCGQKKIATLSIESATKSDNYGNRVRLSGSEWSFIRDYETIATISNDTITINDKEINFIKVNGEVYEIKKVASVEKIGHDTRFGSPPITTNESAINNMVIGPHSLCKTTIVKISLSNLQFDTKGNIIKQ